MWWVRGSILSCLILIPFINHVLLEERYDRICSLFKQRNEMEKNDKTIERLVIITKGIGGK